MKAPPCHGGFGRNLSTSCVLILANVVVMSCCVVLECQSCFVFASSVSGGVVPARPRDQRVERGESHYRADTSRHLTCLFVEGADRQQHP